MKSSVKIAVLILSIAIAVAAYKTLGKNSNPNGNVIPPANAAVANPASAVPVSAAAQAAGASVVAEVLPDSEEASNGSSKVLLAPDIGTPEWQVLIASGQTTIDVVPSTVPHHPVARHIVVSRVGLNPWEVQIAHPLNVALKANDHIQLSFFARSQNSSRITAVVEQSSVPWTKVLTADAKLSPEWKHYSATWTQAADTPANWAKMDFQVGLQVGTLDITGVTIRKL